MPPPPPSAKRFSSVTRWCKPRHATQSPTDEPYPKPTCKRPPSPPSVGAAEPSLPLQKLEEMTERDWRILKEDFEIAVKGGQVLIAIPLHPCLD